MEILMKTPKKANAKKKQPQTVIDQPFSMKKDVLLPACALFTAIIFLFFFAAIISDTPVTDNEWVIRETYDGENSDSGFVGRMAHVFSVYRHDVRYSDVLGGNCCTETA